MRYFITLNNAGHTLKWLLARDASPRILPVFSDDANVGLVVAHLLNGGVLAEVLPRQKITNSVGPGLPLGRLYFQIPRAELFAVCPNLTNQAFEPKLGE